MPLPKTFEIFVLTYSRTMAYAANKKGEPVPRRLDVDGFRQRWFLCVAFEKGIELGIPSKNTLAFTKAKICGNGAFELFLKKMNRPIKKAFTAKFARNIEAECKIKHRSVVGDGHTKTHFVTCSNKRATVVCNDII